jgi:hypothetical protein
MHGQIALAHRTSFAAGYQGERHIRPKPRRFQRQPADERVVYM